MSAATPPCRPDRVRRTAYWVGALAVISALVYLMATASTGPLDPTEVRGPQSSASVVTNASIIVFREGLEAVLIFAAITASFLGANKARRRPVVLGAGCAFLACVGGWFVAQAVLDAASPLGPRLEAITGFLAIVVLLLVLNWFVHKVYWSEWIGKHHRQRRRLLASTGLGATFGLVMLGFTSVFREGIEVVLFLQNLEVRSGSGVVLEGVAIGLAGTAVVGLVTFWLHHRLPYKRMLVLTGVLVGAVLMVMIGGTALTFGELGWIPLHATPFSLPAWLGSWLEMYAYWETLAAQVLAGAFVVGSYYLAEEIKVKRPRRRGLEPARRSEAAPDEAPAEPFGEPAFTA